VEKLKYRKFEEEIVEPGLPIPQKEIDTTLSFALDRRDYPNAFFESLYEDQSIEFLEDIQNGLIPDLLDMDPEMLSFDEGNLYCSIVDSRSNSTDRIQPTTITLQPTFHGLKRSINHFINNEFGNLTSTDMLEVEGQLINYIHQIRKTLCLDPKLKVNDMENYLNYNETKQVFRRKSNRKVILTIDGNPSIHSSMAKISYGKPHPLKPYMTDGKWSKKQFKYTKQRHIQPPDDKNIQQMNYKLDQYHHSPHSYFQQYKDKMLTKLEDKVRELECSNQDKTVYYYIFVMEKQNRTANIQHVDFLWYMVTNSSVNFLEDRIESNGADSFCERLQELLRTDKYNVEKKILNKETYLKRINQLKEIYRKKLYQSKTRRTMSMTELFAKNPAIYRKYQEIRQSKTLTLEQKKEQIYELKRRLANISQAGPT